MIQLEEKIENINTTISMREYQLEDAKVLAEIRSKKEVSKYFDQEPISATDFDNEARDSKSAYYTIILKKRDEEEKIIGCFIYSMIDTKNNKCYIQYFIDPSYHKRGYGYIMMKLAIKLGKEEYKLNKMIANVIEGNSASINLLSKSIFIYTGTYYKHFLRKNGKYKNVVIFEYLY